MKIILLIPKDLPPYYDRIYASLHSRIGTCDVVALTYGQLNDFEGYITHANWRVQYDRIVLVCTPELVHKQGRFLRKLNNLTILRLDLDAPEQDRWMQDNFLAMPWLRWIGSDVLMSRRYADLGFDSYWIPPVYDDERFHHERAAGVQPRVFYYDVDNRIRDDLLEHNKKIVMQEISSQEVSKQIDVSIKPRDIVIFWPAYEQYNPKPMIQAMACGAVVLTPDPGIDRRVVYGLRDSQGCIFVNDATTTIETVRILQRNEELLSEASNYAVVFAQNFRPQEVGRRIAERLELPVRKAGDFRRRERIFGFEI